jgi:hypothetical protein
MLYVHTHNIPCRGNTQMMEMLCTKGLLNHEPVAIYTEPDILPTLWIRAGILGSTVSVGL